MGTPLQLLSNYYKSVIESEKIYYESNTRNIGENDGSTNKQAECSPRMVQEMLILQRQIAQLTAELHLLRKENDNLKQVQKAQKALMESKLNNCKKTIDKLKRVNQRDLEEDSNTGGENQKDRVNFHLLSPLNVRTLDGVSKQNYYIHSSNKPTGLRQVITSGHQTLFDGDDSTDNISGDRSEDIVFINAQQNRDKLANIVLPKDCLSDDEDSRDIKTSKFLINGVSNQAGKKKRKLARKRITTGQSGSDSDVCP